MDVCPFIGVIIIIFVFILLIWLYLRSIETAKSIEKVVQQQNVKEPTQQSPKSNCSFCGKQIIGDYSFCPFCGKEIQKQNG